VVKPIFSVVTMTATSYIACYGAKEILGVILIIFVQPPVPVGYFIPQAFRKEEEITNVGLL